MLPVYKRLLWKPSTDRAQPCLSEVGQHVLNIKNLADVSGQYAKASG